ICPVICFQSACSLGGFQIFLEFAVSAMTEFPFEPDGTLFLNSSQSALPHNLETHLETNRDPEAATLGPVATGGFCWPSMEEDPKGLTSACQAQLGFKSPHCSVRVSDDTAPPLKLQV
ncbi:hypothetical protein NHX12_022182, partial [Muraenolepis orangiensis]